jgi:hypothetical protein
MASGERTTGRGQAEQMMATTRMLLLSALLLALPCAASAEEVVELGGGLFGGGRALLNKPAGKARAGLVLLTGGDGYVGIGSGGDVARQGNWIVRMRGAYARSGIASILVDGNADPSKAIDLMRSIAPRVIVVAMSRGSLKIPGLLASRPDGVVFVSSMLDDVRATLSDASRLPPSRPSRLGPATAPERSGSMAAPRPAIPVRRKPITASSAAKAPSSPRSRALRDRCARADRHSSQPYHGGCEVYEA